MTLEAGLLILIVCLIAIIMCVTMRIIRRDAIDLGSWPFLPEDKKEPELMTKEDIALIALSEWKRKALAIYPNLDRLIRLRDKAISKDVYYET